MGKAFGAVLRLLVPMFVVCWSLSGCQTAPGLSEAKLLEHREQVDETGLAKLVDVEPLKVSLAAPNGWRPLPLQPAKLYTHQQWRSPSRRTAVGVTYIRLPLPLNPQMLVFFASREASKQAKGGKVLRRWSDSIGREWFEVENEKYHMTGYVMARGTDAWINYVGYRMLEEKMPGELELATRALDTVLPIASGVSQQAVTDAK